MAVGAEKIERSGNDRPRRSHKRSPAVVHSLNRINMPEITKQDRYAKQLWRVWSVATPRSAGGVVHVERATRQGDGFFADLTKEGERLLFNLRPSSYQPLLSLSSHRSSLLYDRHRTLST